MREQYILRQIKTIYALAYLTNLDKDDDSVTQETWMLGKIFVDRKRRGHHYGSIMLDRICHDADDDDVILLLEVSPDWDSPIDEKGLYDFYCRRGFEDFESGLIRMPNPERIDKFKSDPREGDTK